MAEVLLRKCWVCKKVIPLIQDNFYINKTKSDGWATECRTCHKSTGRVRRSAVRKRFINSKGNKCNNCSIENENYMFFDIDHIIPLITLKEKRKQYLYDSNSQVLCPNCHRDKTIVDFNWGKNGK